jgi:demethylmenaquinone methyltransferase / 2-methoxy-6-polyprenyl-1,4-benzoquinol methylase
MLRPVSSSNYSGPEAAKIRDMFRSISGRYDRANTVLSGGIHHLWRRKTVQWAGVRAGDRVLDCATGTGLLALAFQHAGGEVIGTDFVPEMLEIARRKTDKVKFESGDVTNIAYPDNSFDIASIGFGIRNVDDPARGISEMARVVRPGGRVIVLEFGQPRNRAFRALFDLYSARVLPRLGGAVTGNREAYEYLERSSSRFPSGEAFVELMRSSASFASIDYRPLSFGIAWIYRGVKQ